MIVRFDDGGEKGCQFYNSTLRFVWWYKKCSYAKGVKKRMKPGLGLEPYH